MYHTDQFDLLKARISRILAFHPPHPGAKTWYVGQAGGSDTTGDGSEDDPYATITFCLTQASVMDTIIAWGTFTEDSIAPVTGQRLIGLGNGLTVLNKTTNTNSGIISSNPGIEVTGFIIDGSASTGHGIELQNGNDAHIHHNVIRNITGAYDGIDKGLGGIITGAKIHHNLIIDVAVGAGIGMVNVTESEFERNICLRNAAHGIILNASCDNNVLRENICNENNDGIELQGDNNEVVDNVMLNNTVANYVDSGANNTRSDLQKKPEWGTPVSAVSTPAGIPALTTAFQFNPPAPGRVALTLDISNYVGGDTCLIYLQQSVDGLNWRNVGYINIVNGNITDIMGPGFGAWLSAVVPAATAGGVQFDIHVDQILALRLQHNQTVGAGPRDMPYHYNYFREI